MAASDYQTELLKKQNWMAYVFSLPKVKCEACGRET